MNAYYSYLFTSMRGLDESDVMTSMPTSLRRQLSIALNRKLFLKVPLFKYCDAHCILALVERLRPTMALPGDYIIREGEVGTALYLVSRGRVLVLKRVEGSDAERRDSGDAGGKPAAVKRSSTQLVRDGSASRYLTAGASSSSEKATPRHRVVAHLSDYDFFGEQALLSEKRTSASVRAATYCDLMALGVGDFHDVVRNFPTFASIVDRLAGKIAGTRSVSGASPTRGSVSGKWGSALAKARLMSKSGANASPCGTASGSTSLETPSPARRRSSLDRACSMGDLLHENRNKRRSSTPAVVQYDDGGGGGASGGRATAREGLRRAGARTCARRCRAAAADTWDDDDELLEGSVTQMVVTDVRPDA